MRKTDESVVAHKNSSSDIHTYDRRPNIPVYGLCLHSSGRRCWRCARGVCLRYPITLNSRARGLARQCGRHRPLAIPQRTAAHKGVAQRAAIFLFSIQGAERYSDLSIS